MDKLEIVKNRLFETNASLVVMFSNGEIKEYFNKRVIDIVSILKENKDGLKDAIVADKIIGKVAATLMTKAGVKKVYSKILSKFGKDVFDNNNIPYEYDIITEYVINNEKTGMCPMENKFKDEEDLDVIYDFFCKINVIKKKANYFKNSLLF